MNYLLTPKELGTNLRSGPGTTFSVLKVVGVVNVLEGDVMVGPAPTQWLEILMIDGVPVSQKTYVAAWVCNITVNPLPVVYPDFIYDASTTSEWPIEVFHNDVSIGVFNGTIRVVSKNPTLKLT